MACPGVPECWLVWGGDVWVLCLGLIFGLVLMGILFAVLGVFSWLLLFVLFVVFTFDSPLESGIQKRQQTMERTAERKANRCVALLRQDRKFGFPFLSFIPAFIVLFLITQVFFNTLWSCLIAKNLILL